MIIKFEKRLLPVYLSNFSFFGGLAAYLPFHILYLKQSGITASEVGIMAGITPLVSIFSGILITSLADKYHRHKVVTQLSIAIAAICFSLFLAVPVSLPNQAFKFLHNSSDTASNRSLLDVVFSANQSVSFVGNTVNHSAVLCDSCISTVRKPRQVSFEVSGSLQFWLFCTLRLIGFLFFHPALSLQTAMSIGAVRGDTEKFAECRAFGSFGFLVFAIVQAVINQYCPPPAFVSHTTGVNFFAAVILFDLLMLIAAVLLHFYDLPPPSDTSKQSTPTRGTKAKTTTNLIHSLRDVRLCALLVAITCTGVLYGVIDSYLYWYVEEMQPVALFWAAFLGVAITSEILVIWFSGRIVRRIGEANCILIVLISYSLRFGINGLLHDSWPILATQALNGITFGLHFVAFATYVGRCAPADCVASMQSVANAAHFGLGFAIGGLLGGVLWAKLGGPMLFFACSAFSAIVAVLYAICYHVVLPRYFSHVASSASIDSAEHSELTPHVHDSEHVRIKTDAKLLFNAIDKNEEAEEQIQQLDETRELV